MAKKKDITAIKKTTKKAPAKIASKKEKTAKDVDTFMAELDHPFKAEVEVVRQIIKGVNKNITEEIKWKAPSFSYKGYLVTFNLWAKQHVHLVFHNGAILQDPTGLLEGDYHDRRMVYFKTAAEIKSKKSALVNIIKDWIRIMDAQS